MKNIFLSLIIAAILTACTKEELPETNCKSVLLISDKYTLDKVFIKSDTLYRDRQLCGDDLEKVKSVNQSWWITICIDPNTIEYWHYEIGKKF